MGSATSKVKENVPQSIELLLVDLRQSQKLLNLKQRELLRAIETGDSRAPGLAAEVEDMSTLIVAILHRLRDELRSP